MEGKPHLYEGDRKKPHDWDMHHIMYEVPGFGKLNIDRYIRSREKNREGLERMTLKSRFEASEDPHVQYTLLKEALSSVDVQFQLIAAELVQHINAEVRAELQSLVEQNTFVALRSQNPQQRRVGAKMVQYMSDSATHDALSLMCSSIDEYLSVEDVSVQTVGAQMIALLPDYGKKKKYQEVLAQHVRGQLSSEDLGTEMEATKIMRYAALDKMPELIAQILHGNNTQAQELAAQYIKRLKPSVANPLLRLLFDSNKPRLKQEAAKTVTRLFRTNKKQPEVPQEFREAITETVTETLGSDSVELQKIGVEMLADVVDADKLPQLIQIGMEVEDPEVKQIAVKAIKHIPTNFESSKDMVLQLVLSGMNSADYNIQRVAVAQARHVPEPKKKECMEAAFDLVDRLIDSQDRQEKKHGAEMAYYINHPNMSKLFLKIESDSELLETLFFSRLYPEEKTSQQDQDKDVTTSHRRVAFAKTGSEMTLLRGGSLERSVLVRHIKKSAFLGWMRAFEENETWLEADFDYVPVEPIQSFVIRKNTADVAAGVLDIDLKHWITVSGGRFQDELREKRKNIMTVLQQLGVRHGDLHEGNFFLRFNRKKDGLVDTNTCPRVYVGDFDKSQVKTVLK